jgi:hypothetical protein
LPTEFAGASLDLTSGSLIMVKSPAMALGLLTLHYKITSSLQEEVKGPYSRQGSKEQGQMKIEHSYWSRALNWY